MAQQPYSVSVTYVGGLSGAQISDLSPFGSPNVSDPSVIGNATFQPISLTAITLDSEFASASDLISVRPYKTIKETASVFDGINSFSVLKRFRDSVALPEFISLNVNLRHDDIASLSDKNTVAFTKVIKDTYSTLDSYNINVHKIYADQLSNVSDLIASISVGKGLSDSVSFTDGITQQTFVKQLKDYANPIDMVGIPDNSTFQLIKTVRNTAIANDSISQFTLDAILDPDFASVDDNKAITFVTARSDLINTDDTIKSSAIKVLKDQASINTHTALNVSKRKSDITTINDSKVIHANKLLRDTNSLTDKNVLNVLLGKKDQVLFSDHVNKVDVTKALKDYANPIDAVGIPDGSTFQLVKTLRNSISEVIDAVFVRSSFVKFLNSAQSSFNEHVSFNISNVYHNIQNTSDKLQQFTSHKLLKDYANPVDYVGIPDGSTFQLVKTITNTVNVTESIFLRRHIVRYLDDSIDSSLFTEKLVFDIVNAPKDSVGTSTSYPTFNLHTHLSDYANPVDFVGIPDGSTFALYKTLSNYVSDISDNFTRFVDYNRTFANDASTYDNIIYDVILGKSETASINEHAILDVNKVYSDSSTINEYKVINTHKVASDNYSATSNITSIINNKLFNDSNGLSDKSVWSFTKSVSGLDSYTATDSFSKVVNYIRHNDESVSSNDLLTQKTFNKHVNLSQSTSDNITQFTSHKLLKDYANPIDFVGIPDNSTFQLTKTITNYISNITDNLTYRLDWVRYYNDTQSVDEKLSFNTHKLFSDIAKPISEIQQLSRDIVSGNVDSTSTSELKTFALNKLRTDSVSQSDLTKLRASIVKHDTQSLTDKASRLIKPLKRDNVTTSETKKLNTHVVLSDGFNEQVLGPLTQDVDFEVASSPDIDTTIGFGTFDFQTGSNQFSVISDAIKQVSFNKHLFDYANPIDYISIPDGSTFNLNKTIANFISANESIALKSISYRRYTDSTGVNEKLIKSSHKNASSSTSTLDSFSRHVSFNRIFNDVVYTTDLTTPRLFKSGDVVGYDTTYINDNLTRVASYNRLFNDIINANDHVFKTDHETKGDTTSVNDQLTHYSLFVRRFSDMIIVDDHTSLRSPNAQTNNDAIGVSSSGNLYIQNYVMEAYFAEDYVGETRSFV